MSDVFTKLYITDYNFSIIRFMCMYLVSNPNNSLFNIIIILLLSNFSVIPFFLITSYELLLEGLDVFDIYLISLL